MNACRNLLAAWAGVLLSLCNAAAAAEAPLERLAWLSGCWKAEGAEPGSGEQWLPLAGNTMLGVARTVRRGATVAHEFMQIRQAADGSGVFFIAQPAGRPEAAFTLLPGGAGMAVFENLQHDFPQRVIYRLGEDGRLNARIEGLRNGGIEGIDFPLTRIACDAQPALAEAFQGLPWGASQAQMALRFGPALQWPDCGTAPSRPGQRAGEACRHALLPRYEVAAVPFRLHLMLDDRLQQLVRVQLAWAGDAAAGSETGFSEKHRLLRQLLTQRYGSPEATHVSSEPEAWNATARWRRGDTLIELVSTFLPRKGNTGAREQVEINYQPITAGEAGKL